MKLSRLGVVLVSVVLATPAVIFWLWLVVVPARVPEECPKGCQCEEGGLEVYCTDSNLNDISFNYIKMAEKLELKQTEAKTLQKNIFISRGLSELEILIMEKGTLTEIELGAFNGLTMVTYLSMESNKIREISPGTFKELISLKYLNLRLNVIEVLDRDIFLGLVNLRCINLRENKLRQIHPNVFSGLPNLHTLILYNNPDLHIPSHGTFISSPAMKRLFISKCGVRSLTNETFANVSTLELLDLSSNKLEYLDLDVFRNFRKLSVLLLNGNPLHCDCKLKEVWQWGRDREIAGASGAVYAECHIQKRWYGIDWYVLNECQCSEGNKNTCGQFLNMEESHPTSVHIKRVQRIAGGRPQTPLTSLYESEGIHCNGLYDYEQSTETYKNRTNLLNEIQGPVLAVPFTFGTIGNMIIIIIIICNKDMRTVPNMYILNLAISDIIYLSVYFSEAWIYKISDTWLDDNFVCNFLPYCRRLSVGLSAYSVTVLSIIRYRVIVNALHVRVPSQPTWWVTAATVCGVWIVAALFAIPSAFSEHLCHAHVISDNITYYELVVVFETLVSCVLPLCVIGFSYIMTARNLMKSVERISEETQNPQINKRKSTVKIVLALTVVFLISSVPYHVLWSYIIYAGTPFRAVASNIRWKIHYFQFIYLVSNSLLLLNPCLNPVALFWTSLAFREQLKRYLNCCRKVSSHNSV